MSETKQVPELRPPPVDNFPPVLDEIKDQTVTEINLGTPAEETIASKNAVEITFRCSGLEDRNLLSKSDPFLKISRIVETGDSVPICQTEVNFNNLCPIWDPLYLEMEQFGSKDNYLLIECFDFDTRGDDHVLIGKIQKSLADLELLHRGKVGANFVLPPSRHNHHEKVLKSQLFVDGFVEKKPQSFLDYICSGFDLNFPVAVDFTASNGNTRNSDSLHNIDPSGRLNAYQQAIMEVGEVIHDSRRFPAWCFGGTIPNGLISPCFGSERLRQLGYENVNADQREIRKKIKVALAAGGFDIGGSVIRDNVGRLYSGLDGGGEVTNQEVNKWFKEVVQKRIEEALKPYIDNGILRQNGEDHACINIKPDNNADPTSGNLQLMMKNIAESPLNKVNEIVLATSAQGAFSLIAYASIKSPSSTLADSPVLLGVVGANTFAFATSLTSLCLRSKKPRTSSFLAKVGALAVTVAVIGSMAMYIPVNIQWIASLAAALPALAVLYA